MLETMLRLESELDRLGRGLADVNPTELADIAWRIDSPELHAIALRLKRALERRRTELRGTDGRRVDRAVVSGRRLSTRSIARPTSARQTPKAATWTRSRPSAFGLLGQERGSRHE